MEIEIKYAKIRGVRRNLFRQKQRKTCVKSHFKAALSLTKFRHCKRMQ